jgi:hypothetical protein
MDEEKLRDLLRWMVRELGRELTPELQENLFRFNAAFLREQSTARGERDVRGSGG